VVGFGFSFRFNVRFGRENRIYQAQQDNQPCVSTAAVASRVKGKTGCGTAFPHPDGSKAFSHKAHEANPP
jgi:hypothetical protein